MAKKANFFSIGSKGTLECSFTRLFTASKLEGKKFVKKSLTNFKNTNFADSCTFR